MAITTGYAQFGTVSNLRTKKISLTGNKQLLDTLSIVPNTVIVRGVPDSAFQVDYVNASIRFLRKDVPDSAEILYRVYPYKFNRVYYHLNYDSIRNNFISEKPYVYRPDSKSANNLFDFGSLNYSGSFGRGITFGNSQDAVVNSSLNLQLSGIIGDSLELLAAITDNNIPIQPDGNTQSLSDFDKVLLQVRKKVWQVSLGDIDLRQSQNYFLNFYKRLQGVSYSTAGRLNGNVTHSLLLSGAVAKGKFNTNTLTPTEGNQGPYRLHGANNELYFIVLAGTERVYMDGALLQRGEDQDYVINYNTAEITFTPKRMVTKDKRIQVEFEYADRNFLNSTLYASEQLNFNKKFSLNVGVYSNQDARNSSIDQSLDDKQKQFLADVGDGIDTAYYMVAVRDTFSSGKILYKKIDTLYNASIHDSIFVQSSSVADVLYSVSFTYLGPGNGNYVQDNTAANGKVFKWVAPADNKKNGDWQPVALLVTPKKQQIANISTVYRFNNNASVKTDIAVSKYDINLFSRKDKNDDNGIAAKVQYLQEGKTVSVFKHLMRWQSAVGYEYVQKNFKPLERLRNVEFNRDWGITNLTDPVDEHLANVSLGLIGKTGNKLNYEVVNYRRSDTYNAFRHLLSYNATRGTWKVIDAVSMTHISTGQQKGVYIRPSAEISKIINKWHRLQTGISYSGEYNRQRDKITDTLISSSFAFSTWQVYLRSDDRKANKWGVSYFTRSDFYPIYKGFQKADKSKNASLFTEWVSNERHQVKFNLTYRKLYVVNSSISRQKADESILGRAEYFINEWNGFISGNVLYELGAGQEQKREFTYMEVPTGQGEYTWIDYNGNGIAELNEFEIAQYTDQKKYIKINTPTNQYVKANYVQFNYHFDVSPRSLIGRKNKHTAALFLSRINLSTTWQVNKKNISNGKFLFDPFTRKIVDSTLLTVASFLSNTFFFNRSNTRWGMEFTNTSNKSKSLLTYGFESRDVQTLLLKARVNMGRRITTTLTLRTVSNDLTTPTFDNRNYNIEERYAEPSVSYTNSTKFRILLSYAYADKKNALGYNEHAANHTFNTDIKYNVLSNATLGGKFSVHTIRYTYTAGGSFNSTVGYVMLDGLLPGVNYVWNMELTKRLAGNLEMSLQYDGRKPASSHTVHIGSASVRAIF